MSSGKIGALAHSDIVARTCILVTGHCSDVRKINDTFCKLSVRHFCGDFDYLVFKNMHNKRIHLCT